MLICYNFYLVIGLYTEFKAPLDLDIWHTHDNVGFFFSCLYNIRCTVKVRCLHLSSRPPRNDFVLPRHCVQIMGSKAEKFLENLYNP